MIEIIKENVILRRLEWLEAIESQNRIFTGKSYEIIKRLMDLTIVISLSPLWLPLIVLIAFCIKLSDPSAPVIFVQKRMGRRADLISIYKFRTMVRNAEELKYKYKHLNELKWPDFKIEKDPRITMMGHFLRKSSFDELPQLFNVLMGNMSLVGPRPTAIPLYKFKLWQTQRCEVLPGITGLWQITGRNESGFDTRIRLDIAYVKKRCLWLDIQILFRTIPAVLSRKHGC